MTARWITFWSALQVWSEEFKKEFKGSLSVDHNFEALTRQKETK